MVLETKKGDQQKRTRNLLISISLGIFCAILSILTATLDPLLLFVRSKLRLVNEGLIHEILRTEYKGLYIEFYVFNVTNGDRFLSGEDQKLQLQEVGPFVYQEYRTNEDIEILPNENVMRYTPNIRAEFIPEASIGDPKNITLNLPNFAFLSITATLSTYPFIVRKLYQLIAAQQNAKPIIKQDVYSFLWDYKDPLVTIVNKVVPGLFYYENIAIADRLYDPQMVYRLELGATEEDKFQVKWVNKTLRNKMAGNKPRDASYNNTYEGMGYPPQLPPDAPRHFYRHGICKTFELQYIGNTMLCLNTEGQAFNYSRRTFENKKLCDVKGYCPYGLLDLSDCFMGIPVALSRGHFTDADPALFNRIDGLQPDPVKHENYFLIEPKVGLLISGKTSLQANLVMGNLKYSPRVHMFTDMVIPLVSARAITPPLPDIIQTKLDLFFLKGYKVMLVIEIALGLAGILLFGRASLLLYSKYTYRGEIVLFQQVPNPNNTEDIFNKN
ncbi:hypothetical protein K1T71_006405 [Dendrolimus kikuchii]|uniref:Uncharacterized protein n=1 Tax=Dendrolimus kikuchii TaxID=765133 RepID=A0ACC1D2B9_9NEOP|nr:hypothetical protein K1T71_006405 [Dendrolimus kikuchii]